MAPPLRVLRPPLIRTHFQLGEARPPTGVLGHADQHVRRVPIVIGPVWASALAAHRLGAPVMVPFCERLAKVVHRLLLVITVGALLALRHQPLPVFYHAV